MKPSKPRQRRAKRCYTINSVSHMPIASRVHSVSVEAALPYILLHSPPQILFCKQEDNVCILHTDRAPHDK